MLALGWELSWGCWLGFSDVTFFSAWASHCMASGFAGSRSSRKRGHKLPALLKARPWAGTESFRHIVLAKQAQSQCSFRGNWNKPHLSLMGVVEIGHLSAYILSTTLKVSFHCFLMFIVCDEKPNIKIIIVPLYVLFCLPLKFKTLSFFFSSLTMMSLDVIFFILAQLGLHWASLIVGSCISPIWKILSVILSNFFSFVSSIFTCYLICWRRENLRPCSWIWKYGSWCELKMACPGIADWLR